MKWDGDEMGACIYLRTDCFEIARKKGLAARSTLAVSSDAWEGGSDEVEQRMRLCFHDRAMYCRKSEVGCHPPT